MNKTLRWMAVGVAVAGMGITMPSCPGQQAMQQQIDALQTKNNELNTKVQGLDASVKAANAEIAKLNQNMGGVAGILQAQKTAIDQLTTSVKELQAAKSAAPKGKTAAAPKKKGR